MKIRVIACCKNEEAMLPFFLQYYSVIADEILIFDGGSTDQSCEIVTRWPKAKVFVKHEDEMDERNMMWVRNEAYKIGRELFDWQIIVDVDEFLYYKHGESLLKRLQQYMRDGITIPTVIGYDMYDLKFPEFYSDNTIIDQIRIGKRNDRWQAKNVIFNPKKVDINYDFGCHSCKPTGELVSCNDKLALLHYNFVSYDHFIRRHKYNASRMSAFNKERNLAFHISELAQMTEIEFNDRVRAVHQNPDENSRYSTWRE